MKPYTHAALLAATLACVGPASAQVTLYENDGYSGRSLTTDRAQNNLSRSGFNDRASSAIVTRDRWEVCSDAGFGGSCVVLRRGNYPSLAAMGLNDRVSSVRQISNNARVEDGRYGPPPVVDQDYRRRGGERLFQADVIAVRAVVATPERRCWIEREQVTEERRREPNVGGAVAGAVIGGILGHQIGGGTGRDVATIGGVVGGAALGSRVGGDGQRVVTRDVQRCADGNVSAQPDYWDVTYRFRGQAHTVQMTTPPGATVTVNRQGEPRA